MNQYKTYYIGKLVNFTKAYATQCCERFPSTYDETTFQPNGRCKEAISIESFFGQGYVIGIKMAIMSDYYYTPESSTQGFEDEHPDVVRACATGKREQVLVVVSGIKGKANKPFFVRYCDLKS